MARLTKVIIAIYTNPDEEKGIMSEVMTRHVIEIKMVCFTILFSNCLNQIPPTNAASDMYI